MPTPYTIIFTASDTASFTAAMSVIKATSTTSATLDTKRVGTATSYDYDTLLKGAGKIHF